MAFEQQLAELSHAGKAAAKACDSEALEAVTLQLARLEPAACPAHGALSAGLHDFLETLKTRKKAIDQDTSSYRSKIAVYELEWGTAFKHCDLEELGSVAHAIVAWSGNSCVLENLDRPDLQRVAMLEQNTIQRVATLRTLKEQVESVLLAKLRLGEGYVRTLEQMTGDRQPALDAVRRIQSAAEDYIDFARIYAGADGLPELCYSDDLDQVRSLVSTLERLIGKLGRILVPDLAGKSEELALAWVGDLNLRPLVQPGDSTADPRRVGTVARQAPAAGTPLRARETVTLWIYQEPSVDNRVDLTPMTQVDCDRKWSGTQLRENPGGQSACFCPTGTAWSKVQGQCLSLAAGGGSGGAYGRGSTNCSHMPGTLFNPRAGHCTCPVGSWVESQGRCVDTVAVVRQKEIDNAQQAHGCEYLLSSVRAFRRHPSAIHRQMAASAETKARTLGCDSVRVEEAIAEGDQRVWSTPPTGGGSDAVAVGPQVPERRDDLQPLTQSAGQPPEGESNDPQSSNDCTQCKTYSDWLATNRGPCGYHPLRLPSICALDPDCVHWNEQCVRHQRLLNECMAGCSR